MGQQKVWIQALGPPRRDPGRNSASDPGLQVPNGGMATHLVAKRCDLGSLGVPGPASTPCGRAGGRRAVAPTPTPLVSTHPPKIAIPLLGGTRLPLGVNLAGTGSMLLSDCGFTSLFLPLNLTLGGFFDTVGFSAGFLGATLPTLPSVLPKSWFSSKES